MKKLLVVCALFSSASSFAGIQHCGEVKIDQVLSGPRHGAMIKVSNKQCGNRDGWICLDPDGEYMTKEKSQRTYALALSAEMTKRTIQISIDNSAILAGCGSNYPTIEDIRTVK